MVTWVAVFITSLVVSLTRCRRLSPPPGVVVSFLLVAVVVVVVVLVLATLDSDMMIA